MSDEPQVVVLKGENVTVVARPDEIRLLRVAEPLHVLLESNRISVVTVGGGSSGGGGGGGSGDITSVGDVLSGAAFDGTQGTTLTSTTAGLTLTAATVGSGPGGPINIRSGASGAGGSGAIIISSGPVSGSVGNSAPVIINTGTTVGVSTNTGNIIITTGVPAAAGGISGDVQIGTGGVAEASAESGELFLSTGASTLGPTGGISIVAGTAATIGGPIILAAGYSAATPGYVELRGGNATAGGVAGGAINLYAGNGGDTGNGGAINISSGSGGTTSGNTGAIVIGTATSSAGNSGNIDIATGSGATGFNSGNLSLWTGANGAGGVAGDLIFMTQNTERFRIDGPAGTWLLAADPGTAGFVLTSGGAGVAPTWATPSVGDITSVGDVASGDAFGGTQGTTLTSTTVGFNIFVANATSGDGGIIQITGGSASVGAGGYIQISGGDALSGNQLGGDVYINGGLSQGTAAGTIIALSAGGAPTSGVGGSIELFAGFSNQNTGGAINLTAGSTGSITGARGGAITLTSGFSGSSAGGASGDITIQTGGTNDADTGAVIIKTSDATGTNRSTGDITLTTGTPTGSGTRGGIVVGTDPTGSDLLRVGGSGIFKKSDAAGIRVTIENTDTTFDPGPFSQLYLKTASGSAADPYIWFGSTGSSQDWMIGIDHSDGNKFKIQNGTAPSQTFTDIAPSILEFTINGAFTSSWTTSGAQRSVIFENNAGTGTSAGINFDIRAQNTDGDPVLRFRSSASVHWTTGFDASDSNSYKISNGTVLGTNDRIIVTTAGAISLPGAVTLGSTLSFTTAASRIIPGATSLQLRNNADSADNLLITNAGDATVRLSLTVNNGLSALIGAGAAIQAIRSSGGDRLLITPNGAGAGAWIQVQTDALTDFTGLTVFSAGTTLMYRTGAGSTTAGLTLDNSGDTTLAHYLKFSTAASRIIPGATSLALRNNADSADNILIADAGGVTLRTTLTFATAASKIIPGATSLALRNNADSADNILIADAGDVTIRRDLTIAGASIPQNSQSVAYTTVLADANKHLLHPSADTTARTFTIDSNANVAYRIGTAITFVNQNAAGVLSIAITSDTMRLAGPGTTGTRTLAANGIATALKVTSTEWIISGTGLS